MWAAGTWIFTAVVDGVDFVVVIADNDVIGLVDCVVTIISSVLVIISFVSGFEAICMLISLKRFVWKSIWASAIYKKPKPQSQIPKEKQNRILQWRTEREKIKRRKENVISIFI